MPPPVVSRRATGRVGYGSSATLAGAGAQGPRTGARPRSGALVGPTRRTTTSAPAASRAVSPTKIPSMPTGPAAPAAPAGPSSAPPEITKLTLEGKRDPQQQKFMQDYLGQIEDVKAGRTREAQVFKSDLEADLERQVAQARQQAAADGRPFDEESFRIELKRGQYKAQADFELGAQEQTTEAMQGGLDIVKSPWESEMAEKGFSQGTEQLLMDYALGRGGLVSEDKRTAVMSAGQAIDAYKAFLSMMGGGGAFNFSSSYG